MKTSILLVGDEDCTRDLLVYYFKTKGYDVEIAKTKEKVLTLTDNKQFHLILFDYDTPEIDSAQVCEAIREYSDVPIVFISDERSMTEIINSFSIGGSDFIKKPVDFTQLETRLKANLHLSKS